MGLLEPELELDPLLPEEPPDDELVLLLELPHAVSANTAITQLHARGPAFLVNQPSDIHLLHG
ncbi:MAG TPA: hypothetical protein VME22_11910 [Solirubrobacteraceae bacterium]|nr:hypothetical protein [Solirubrobacteraceae bacterium]